MGTDRETDPCQARKEGSRGETSFFCQLTAIKSISLCKFSQPASLSWAVQGIDSGTPGGWGGSRSSSSSFLLLPVLKKEKLKIYFPCTKILVKENFQKHFLNKSDFFFSQNAKLGFILKTSLLRKTMDLEMQNLIHINTGI